MDASVIDNILIFKTNIINPVQVATLASVLDLSDDIAEWNIDMEDCDHILRVVSGGIEIEEVIERLNDIGFHCEELQD